MRSGDREIARDLVIGKAKPTPETLRHGEVAVEKSGVGVAASVGLIRTPWAGRKLLLECDVCFMEDGKSEERASRR